MYISILRFQSIPGNVIVLLFAIGKDDDASSMTSELSADVQANPAGKTKETSLSKGKELYLNTSSLSSPLMICHDSRSKTFCHCF